MCFNLNFCVLLQSEFENYTRKLVILLLLVCIYNQIPDLWTKLIFCNGIVYSASFVHWFTIFNVIKNDNNNK